jgi:hypothetical protein
MTVTIVREIEKEKEGVEGSKGVGTMNEYIILSVCIQYTI